MEAERADVRRRSVLAAYPITTGFRKPAFNGGTANGRGVHQRPVRVPDAPPDTPSDTPPPRLPARSAASSATTLVVGPRPAVPHKRGKESQR
jgi:hypothetical protein